MKGIKRDPSLFPTLKDEKFHDSWHRSFENQMHAQGLHQVINTTYIALTPNEQAVFNLMQTFTYAVLESKVFTTKGKEIVRQHELTRDARATYSALLKHHRSSTASTIAAISWPSLRRPPSAMAVSKEQLRISFRTGVIKPDSINSF